MLWEKQHCGGGLQVDAPGHPAIAATQNFWSRVSNLRRLRQSAWPLSRLYKHTRLAYTHLWIQIRASWPLHEVLVVNFGRGSFFVLVREFNLSALQKHGAAAGNRSSGVSREFDFRLLLEAGALTRQSPERLK